MHLSSLITHHQVPFFLSEQDAAERRAHLISHQTRCDLLAIHAEADAVGRLSPDVPRLIDNIALFRALCEQQGCLNRPRPFASDHSRFLYFRKDRFPPDYEVYDNWENRVTLLSGLPASGKDTGSPRTQAQRQGGSIARCAAHESWRY